nr:ribonuclease H-like domain, reverse transcriptase, RNA-dependent DNA polymerase [Tanacetum cinerariifolium]
MLHQAKIKTRRNLVLAAGDPAGSIVSTGGVPAGSVLAGSIPTSSVPASSVPASSVLADSVPVSIVPTGNVPVGGVLAGSIDFAGFGDLATSEFVHAIFNLDHADNSTLPPEPSSVAKALEDPNWVAAMQEEMQEFFNQQVWKLVPLPDGKIAIGTKWILKNKRDARSWCDEFKVLMKGEFEISSMGELTFFLGLQVKQLTGEIFISQDKYVKDMLKKFNMESVRSVTTPYKVPKPKSKDELDDAVNVHLYRSMIGSFMFLTASRPDIMFSVSAYSRHQVTPMTSYLNTVKKIFKYLKGKPNLGLWYPRDSLFQLEAYSDSDYAGSHGDRKSTTGRYQFLGRRLISWQCKKQTIVATSSTKAEYVAATSCCGQASNAAGSTGVPAGGKGWEAYEQILDFLNRSYIRYALTHHPPIVFDSLVKQFWSTATVRTLEAGPSEIIATIDGNEVVVTESLIRTQLQLNDEIGLSEFTLNDFLDGMREIRCILDGMIGNIGSKRHKFLMYLRLLQMILGIQTIDPSPRPTFDFTTKIFSNMKLNCDGSHMPLLAPMLVVPAGRDGADAAAVNEVPPPSPPPDVPPTYISSYTPGPSTAAQDTPVMDPIPGREPTRVREPTPSPVREPTTFREPTLEPPRPPSPPPCTRSEESNEAPPTTAATATGGAEDSVALTELSLKLDRCIHRVTTLENKLGVTKKVLGGAVLKLVSRVKRLEGILQQRKMRMVLSDFKGKEAATKEQEIDLDALHELASTSLGDDTTVKAAYTIYKAFQDAHASLDAGYDADEVPDTTTMPFRRTRTKRRRIRKTFTSLAFEHFQENIFAVEDTILDCNGIHVDAQTIPASSTPIPTTRGVSAGSSMDLAG